MSKEQAKAKAPKVVRAQQAHQDLQRKQTEAKKLVTDGYMLVEPRSCCLGKLPAGKKAKDLLLVVLKKEDEARIERIEKENAAEKLLAEKEKRRAKLKPTVPNKVEQLLARMTDGAATRFYLKNYGAAEGYTKTVTPDMLTLFVQAGGSLPR